MIRGVIQLSSLGKNGRFGNQIFQYLFAKSYSELNNLELQIPSDWAGRRIFNINDKIITNLLPRVVQKDFQFDMKNVDIFGYFQSSKFTSIVSRKRSQELFSLRNEWNFLNDKKQQYYAAHVRRGDYINHQNIYAIVSQQSYLNCVLQNNLNPVLLNWVTQQNPRRNQVLQKNGLGFLCDFYYLINSDILLRGNSTYSVIAGLLSKNRVFSPLVGNHKGYIHCQFVQGNYPKTVQVDGVDDFNFLP